MKEYMFLIRGGKYNELSPEEIQQNTAKWIAWVKELAEKGKFKAGQPLGNESRVVTGKSRVVIDGPFAESKELVGGFLIVLAESVDEASEIAKGCPGNDVDGIVEIRDISILHME